MPTEEQIERVVEQLEELSKEEFRGFSEIKDGRPLVEWSRNSDWQDGEDGTYLRRLEELDDRGLKVVLDRFVEWDGFSNEQIDLVRESILADREQSRWIEGIEPDISP
jgi:hypothetical protein